MDKQRLVDQIIDGNQSNAIPKGENLYFDGDGDNDVCVLFCFFVFLQASRLISADISDGLEFMPVPVIRQLLSFLLLIQLSMSVQLAGFQELLHFQIYSKIHCHIAILVV